MHNKTSDSDWTYSTAELSLLARLRRLRGSEPESSVTANADKNRPRTPADTSNKFQVVPADGASTVIIAFANIQPLSRDECVNLAAWLVGVNDARADFLGVLDAIEKS